MVFKRKLLLYWSSDDLFILKMEGEDAAQQFPNMADAFMAARNLFQNVPLIMFNSVGKVILKTVA